MRKRMDFSKLLDESEKVVSTQVLAVYFSEERRVTLNLRMSLLASLIGSCKRNLRESAASEWYISSLPSNVNISLRAQNRPKALNVIIMAFGCQQEMLDEYFK